MRLRFALAGLFALTALSALADEALPQGVYRGTLGRQDVVLEIAPVKSETGEVYDGRYFYRRYGITIPLKITRQADGSLRLQELRLQKPSGAEWRLVVAGDSAKGEFCRCDVRKPASSGRKRIAVSLALIPGTAGDSREKTYQ